MQHSEQQGTPLYAHLFFADELYLLAFCQPSLGLLLTRDDLAHRDLFWSYGIQLAHRTRYQLDFV